MLFGSLRQKYQFLLRTRMMNQYSIVFDLYLKSSHFKLEKWLLLPIQ